MAKPKKWIQKAVNPAHKGYCTPMTKSTCTGRRRQFALMMKRKHGFQTARKSNHDQTYSPV
jgi:hypothetical protein